MSEEYLRIYKKLKESGGRETRTARRVFLEKSKEGKKCIDCNVIYPPYILQYDHVKGAKVGNLTDLARSGTMEQLIEELTKCEIVCANCHSHRTYVRSKNQPKSKAI